MDTMVAVRRFQSYISGRVRPCNTAVRRGQRVPHIRQAARLTGGGSTAIDDSETQRRSRVRQILSGRLRVHRCLRACRASRPRCSVARSAGRSATGSPACRPQSNTCDTSCSQYCFRYRNDRRSSSRQPARELRPGPAAALFTGRLPSAYPQSKIACVEQEIRRQKFASADCVAPSATYACTSPGSEGLPQPCLRPQARRTGS